jgi:hypothetical protein
MASGFSAQILITFLQELSTVDSGRRGSKLCLLRFTAQSACGPLSEPVSHALPPGAIILKLELLPLVTYKRIHGPVVAKPKQKPCEATAIHADTHCPNLVDAITESVVPKADMGWVRRVVAR